MIEKKVYPVYMSVIEPISERLSEGIYRILIDADIAFRQNGKTHSIYFVKGIHHVITSLGMLKLVPKTDYEYHQKTLAKIVENHHLNKITYIVYSNGFSGIKIEELTVIKNEILTVSDKQMGAIWNSGKSIFN